MLHMLRSMLGDGAFFSAITSYFTKNAYLSAVSRDLWKHLEQPAKERGVLDGNGATTIQSTMETWVNNSGFPEVNVVRDFESNSVTVYQFRFGWLWTPNDTEEAAMTWPLWVSYHSPDVPDTEGGKLLPAVRSQQLYLPHQLAGKPVVFNKEAGSYIRVRYDARSLCKLAKLLRENHTRVSVVERAQILEDLTPLSMPNPECKPCGIAGWVHMMEYLKKERSLIPWKIAVTNLWMLHKTLQDQKVQPKFYDWMVSLTQPYFAEHGYKMDNERTEEEKRLKQHMFEFACLMISTNPSSPCVQEAFSQFKIWKTVSRNNSRNNPISPYLREYVYKTVLKFSPFEEDVNYILGKYEEAKKLRFRHLEHFNQLKAAFLEFVVDKRPKGSGLARSLDGHDHSMDTICSIVTNNQIDVKDADTGIKVIQDCWYKIGESQGTKVVERIRFSKLSPKMKASLENMRAGLKNMISACIKACNCRLGPHVD